MDGGIQYRFGEMTLDTATGEVRKGGEPVRLRPQAYQLLRVLVEEAPALLARDELLDRVWGVEHLSPSTLKQTVSELRSVLGDDPRRPRYIETVHRRGYRLIAPVERIAAAGPSAGVSEAPNEPVHGEAVPSAAGETPRPRRLALVLGFAAFFVALAGVTAVMLRGEARDPVARTGVMVVPDGAGAGDPGSWETGYAVEALTGALAAQGAFRVVGLDAISKTGIAIGDEWNARQLATLRKTFAVDSVIGVGVRRGPGGRVLAISVIETASGQRRKKLTVPLTGDDPDGAAVEAARRLREVLRPPAPVWGALEGETLVPITSVPEARRLYVEGLERLRGYDVAAAVDLLERAVAADPASPWLHGALAQAYRTAGYAARARAEGQKAMAHAAALPRLQRLALEALASDCALDRETALRKYGALSELMPDVLEPRLRSIRLLVWLGRANEAVREARALESESGRFGRDPRIWLELAGALTAANRYEEAVKAAETSIRIAKENRLPLTEASALRERAWALLELGRTDEALEDMATAGALFRARGYTWGWTATLADRAGVLIRQGRTDQARPLLLEAVRLARENGDIATEATVRHNLAAIQAAEGDLEGATGSLERVLELKRMAGDTKGEAAVLTTLGQVRRAAGDLAAARRYLERAVVLYRQGGQPGGEARALKFLGDVEWTAGDPAAAARRYSEVLAVFRRTGNREEEGRTLVRLGEIATERGDFEAALRYHREADTIFAEIDSRSDRAWNLFELGRLEHRLHDPAAGKDLEAARRLAKELEDAKLLDKLGALESSAATAA